MLQYRPIYFIAIFKNLLYIAGNVNIFKTISEIFGGESLDMKTVLRRLESNVEQINTGIEELNSRLLAAKKYEGDNSKELFEEASRVVKGFKQLIQNNRQTLKEEIEKDKSYRLTDEDKLLLDALKKQHGETYINILDLNDITLFSEKNMQLLLATEKEIILNTARQQRDIEISSLKKAEAERDIAMASLDLARQINGASDTSTIEEIMTQYERGLTAFEEGLDITLEDQHEITGLIEINKKDKALKEALEDLKLKLEERDKVKKELNGLEKQPDLNRNQITQKQQQVDELSQLIKKKQLEVKPILKAKKSADLNKLIQDVKKKKIEEIDKPTITKIFLDIVSFGYYSRYKKRNLEKTLKHISEISLYKQTQQTMKRIEEFKENLKIAKKSPEFLSLEQEKLLKQANDYYEENEKEKNKDQKQQGYKSMLILYSVRIKEIIQNIEKAKENQKKFKVSNK